MLDEGALPIAPAPEDTSYLDEETAAGADAGAAAATPASTADDTFDIPDTQDVPQKDALPSVPPGVPSVSESSDDFNFPEADESAADEADADEADADEAAFDGDDTAAESVVLKNVPGEFKQELRTVLSYMDILLESLPEEKIEEFARSEHFEPYKKLFKELGLV